MREHNEQDEVEDKENRKPQEKQKALTPQRVMRILDEENPSEWEPGQVFNLPINTNK